VVFQTSRSQQKDLKEDGGVSSGKEEEFGEAVKKGHIGMIRTWFLKRLDKSCIY